MGCVAPHACRVCWSRARAGTGDNPGAAPGRQHPASAAAASAAAAAERFDRAGTWVPVGWAGRRQHTVIRSTCHGCSVDCELVGLPGEAPAADSRVALSWSESGWWRKGNRVCDGYRRRRAGHRCTNVHLGRCGPVSSEYLCGTHRGGPWMRRRGRLRCADSWLTEVGHGWLSQHRPAPVTRISRRRKCRQIIDSATIPRGLNWRARIRSRTIADPLIEPWLIHPRAPGSGPSPGLRAIRPGWLR